MLLLLFKVKADGYAMNSLLVKEVIPFLELQKISKAPEYVAGLVNYRGIPVPVVDLCLLLNSEPSQQLMSTRIILTNISVGITTRKIIGLLAEKVNETVKTPVDWQPKSDDQGTMFVDSEIIGHTMYKWFDPQRKLPENIGKLLY